MKSCFNTITAGSDAPLDEIIAACGEAGFDGIELDQRHVAHLLERVSLDEIKWTLDQAHLSVASVMAFNLDPFGDPDTGVAAIRHGAELARAFDAPVLLTFCGAMVPDDMTPEEARRRAGERAALMADAAQPVAIALEPIGRTTVMGGPGEALEIARIANRPNVGIMMDSFHYYLSRVPQEAIRAIPRDKLLIVHLNDSEDRPIAELQDSHRLHVGRGILPLQDDLRILREIGYDGFVSIEIFRPEYWAQPVARVVREAKESLDAELARAGRTK